MTLIINYIRIGFFTIILTGCIKKNRQPEIHPLHPYEKKSFRDLDNPDQYGSITRYFFIKDAVYANDKLSDYVDSFAVESISNDKEYTKEGTYTLWFYRESDDINADFRERMDGMISYSLLSEHEDDLLFRYEWSEGVFEVCVFYKKGKIIKRLYDKGHPLLKRPGGAPATSERNLEIIDVSID